MQVTAISANQVTLLNPATGGYPLASTSGPGLLTQVSGLSTDYVTGANTCQDLTTAPAITLMRLRSFNAIGNSTFEVDQANVGTTLTNVASGARISDRWFLGKPGSVTGTINTNCVRVAQIKVPGTNFVISANQQLIQVGTTQAALAAGDFVRVYQNAEGPQWRELQGDVHSVSILAYSSTVAPYTFAVAIRDAPATKSLVYLLTIPTAATWTLLTLPNLPAFPAGNFTNAIGTIGYEFDVCIACGTTFQAPVTGSWQTGNYLGAAGMTNGLAATNNLYLAFIQHEPGPQCTTLIDKPFSQNYDECCRYFQKSYPYSSAPGVNIGWASPFMYIPTTPAGQVSALGYFPFPHRMAKAPTLTSYATNGTINSATMYNQGTVLAVSSVGGNDGGLTSLTFAAAQTAGQAFAFQYTADTGW
jgi:hypothetical protein